MLTLDRRRRTGRGSSRPCPSRRSIVRAAVEAAVRARRSLEVLAARERREAVAVDADDLGRDALADLGLVARLGQDHEAAVAVQVDEARARRPCRWRRSAAPALAGQLARSGGEDPQPRRPSTDHGPRVDPGAPVPSTIVPAGDEQVDVVGHGPDDSGPAGPPRAVFLSERGRGATREGLEPLAGDLPCFLRMALEVPRARRGAPGPGVVGARDAPVEAAERRLDVPAGSPGPDRVGALGTPQDRQVEAAMRDVDRRRARRRR